MDKISKLMWVIFCSLALLALAYYFQGKLDQQYNPNQSVHSAVDGSGKVSVILKQNRQGHYLAAGTINAQPVVFLLDTGATKISIPAHLGPSLGLSGQQIQRVKTANGSINVKSTTINSLTLGEIKFHGLKAHLNPGMTDNTILLGMNVLKQLELLQRNNTLTLTQYAH